MTRHSKNAESLGHFTHNEKKKLKNVYGTLTQRLGQDSMRKFNACVLCLQTARQPQICTEGHLYCKVSIIDQSCIVENILDQKKQIERHGEIVINHNKNVETKEEEQARIEAERKLKAFVSQETKVTEHLEGKAVDWQRTTYWLPHMQPEAKAEQMKITKSAPQCYGGKTPHPITMKKLIAVIFEEKGSDYICPVCVKSFGNSAEALVLKPCGHAMCKECMNKFCKTQKKCSVCESKYKAVIKIAIEGTGFAASGITEAVKVTPGFL